MITQLLLTKRLFMEGTEFAKRPDAVSCGIAISLLQDAVEMLIWLLIKERGIAVKDGSTFTANLDLVQKSGISIPEAPKLQELNKARVGFKHYGNLPAPDEAKKFHTYVEDFLRSTTMNHFNQNFDEISLVDLVPFPEIRSRLKCAEAHIEKAEFNEAVKEASIAKAELFKRLDKYIPHVDSRLSHADSVIEQSGRTVGIGVFNYLDKYLGMLRDITLVSLLHLPLEDYAFLTATLSQASQTLGGTWHTYGRAIKYDENICKRQIACLVNISIRLESSA